LLLQVTPQDVPSQVATPFDGMGHAVHDAPHVEMLVLDAHALPHAW
jgi:hypothetical protein